MDTAASENERPFLSHQVIQGEICCNDDLVPAQKDRQVGFHATTSPENKDHLKVKILYSVALFTGNFSSSLCMNVFGPTLLELKLVASSTLSQAAMLISFIGIGRVLGSVLVALTIRKLRLMIQIPGLLLLLSVTQLAIPWCRLYAMMSIAACLTGIGGGATNAVVASTWLPLWREKAVPFVHGTALLMTSAACVAPLLAKPFLPEEKANHSLLQWNIPVNTENENNYTDSTTYYDFGKSTNGISNDEPYFSQVSYMFFIVASLNFMTALWLTFLLFNKATNITLSHENFSSNSDKKMPRYKVLLAGFFSASLAIVGIEVSHGGLIMSVVVDFLGWTQDQGSLITFAYFLSSTLGRGMFIILTRIIEPFKTLLFSCFLCVTALAILSVDYFWNPVFIWVSTCILGLSVSAGFGNLISLAYKYGISGSDTSVIYTGAFVGMFGVPGIAGLLMPHLQAKSLMYTNLGTTCSYLLLLISIRCIKPQKK